MQNLLDMTPIRLRSYRVNEKKGDGSYTLLVPKFGTGKFGKWLSRRFKNPDYLVHLDDFGSYVWHLCDGDHCVKDIGESLRTKYGDKIEPVHDRLSLFFRQMEKSKLIAFKENLTATPIAATSLESLKEKGAVPQ